MYKECLNCPKIKAIWAAIEYYYDSRDIINDIEEYSLD